MNFKEIKEGVTDLPAGSTPVEQLEILMAKLEACKRALGIANTLPSPEDRKKYKGRVLGFMNQLRPMFNRVATSLEKELETDNKLPVSPTRSMSRPATSQPGASLE